MVNSISPLKKNVLRVLALLCCCLVLCSLIPLRAEAAAAAEDTLAKELYQAVKNKKSTAKIKAQTTDLNKTLTKAFKKYPALYVYYDGYKDGKVSGKYSEAIFKLKNLDVDWNKIYVASSMSDLENVFAYSLCRQEVGFRAVLTGGVNPTEGDFARFAENLKNDHYLSYMGYNGWDGTYFTNEDAGLTDYDFRFRYWEGLSSETLAQWRDVTEKKALELAGTLFALDMPDYKKELLIHDWLVNNNRYNTVTPNAPESHMAYGALVSGNPVCQGYAEAAMLLCKAAGIPAVYVSGTGTSSDGKTESHGWNCVQIAGSWYNLDSTWDDPVSADGRDSLIYEYFNVTDTQLSRDHTWDRATAPACTATEMNYDRVRALVNADTGFYGDYSNRNVVTRAMTEAKFAPLLKLCPKPDGTVPQVSVPKATSVPKTSSLKAPETPSGSVETVPETTSAPAATSSSVQTPAVSTNPPAEKGTGGWKLFLSMFGLFLVLFGSGVASIVILKRVQKPRYRY